MAHVVNTRHPLRGILLLATSALVLGSLLSSPPGTNAHPLLGLPLDACGQMGRFTARLLIELLGLPLSAWLVFSGLLLGVRAIFPTDRPVQFGLIWSGALATAVSFFAGALGAVTPWGELPTFVGRRVADRSWLGPLGAALSFAALLAIVLLVGLPRLLPARTSRFLAALFGAPVRAGESLAARAAGWFERPPLPKKRSSVLAEKKAMRRNAALPIEPPGGGDPTDLPLQPPAGVGAPHGGLLEWAAKRRDVGGTIAKPESRERKRAPRIESNEIRLTTGGWTVPTLELLEEDTEAPVAIDREEVLENGRVLVRALKDFGILGAMGQIHPGPVVTQYEFEPAAGVKISQIVSRSDDLALALKASRVRMVAPIPGKAAVGIEVPNRAASKILLRRLLGEVDLHALPGELPLVFGRDIRGRPYTTRLDAMPHLLIAGTTGSGKSVCLNTLLLSLLFRRTPEDLRLLLIDPKMLELTPYDGIPHLLAPVVTEPKMAARMMQWLVSEMERRYRKMAAVGVRHIAGYREKAKGAKSSAEGFEPMPYIVVIVDELADLMLTVGNEIENPIMRLAQMARAVGIHLVLATQRPSVDVLTGVIKANFPARIAFQVASKVDSRTILDANGAESLLGKGDMLFLPPGRAEAVRVHGCFVSERDAEEVVRFLRAQPVAPVIFSEEALLREGEEPGFDDELFEDALRLIVVQRMASTSFLQRRLKVGYSRAGRLMDLLEQVGAVGPQDGSKTREVLADQRFLENWLQRERARVESGS